MNKPFVVLFSLSLLLGLAGCHKAQNKDVKPDNSSTPSVEKPVDNSADKAVNNAVDKSDNDSTDENIPSEENGENSDETGDNPNEENGEIIDEDDEDEPSLSLEQIKKYLSKNVTQPDKWDELKKSMLLPDISVDYGNLPTPASPESQEIAKLNAFHELEKVRHLECTELDEELKISDGISFSMISCVSTNLKERSWVYEGRCHQDDDLTDTNGLIGKVYFWFNDIKNTTISVFATDYEEYKGACVTETDYSSVGVYSVELFDELAHPIIAAYTGISTTHSLEHAGETEDDYRTSRSVRFYSIKDWSLIDVVEEEKF